ncbi:YolD-like family protein [Bacillus sp. FJAT-49711]|uniref:YolD-like family protein n=1 Tax=Bacillus sp. FJAT-49711 TaxID=2833585 RepID=UPI001BCA21AB|nr:YolD-like family protein [Bacillus sp. FJAT-49711]MBS4220086.1 YolD-like family protein [Bacillus sp. FJAT-49711]
MDLKDRGMKKWHGFFMPEHVSSLKEMRHNDEKVKKPVLDENQLQEIDETLHVAIEINSPIIITLWIDGFFNKKEGFLHHIHNLDRYVRIVDNLGNASKIDFENIIKVEIAD